MKKIIFTVLFAIFGVCAFGQKNSTDSLTVELKKYKVIEQTLPAFGTQKAIEGVVIIKTAEGKTAKHSFLAPIINGSVYHVVVYDSNKQRQEPRIYYRSSEKCLTYYENTDSEGKVDVSYILDQKDLVLEALKIWAKLVY